MLRQTEERSPATWVLPALMMLGGIGGIGLGTWLGPHWEDPALEPVVVGLGLLGSVFLSLLKALIVPLVVTSMVLGVRTLGALRNVARLASMTALYFLTTTAIAVVTGIVLVQWIGPGRGGVGLAEAGPVPAVDSSPFAAVAELVSGMFPPNLVAAAAEGNVLGLIVFSLVFGLALARIGSAGDGLAGALEGLNQALMLFVRWLVWLAPLGILGLVAERLGRAGGGGAALAELARLWSYALTVSCGLLVHACVTLPLLLWLVARRDPRRYLRGMLAALLTAFGTASSAATLPLTLRGVIENNGVSRRAADFVLPLGTTVNMDGTALYEAVAVVFIAQTLGIELTLVQLVIVALSATLAAIGAAAIPEAGLVTMVLVLEAVDLPVEGIGLLLSIDWILDRLRTSVNVWGDSIGAAVIERGVPDGS